MKRHDYDQMYELYKQWQASGNSKTDFAEAHGIRPTTFYYWIRKFEKGTSVASSGFETLTFDEPFQKNSEELMAAIQYPTGVRLELYSSFQKVSSSYAELLKTLTGQC